MLALRVIDLFQSSLAVGGAVRFLDLHDAACLIVHRIDGIAVLLTPPFRRAQIEHALNRHTKFIDRKRRRCVFGAENY